MAIGVLSPKLASRIAAGEVIERPASVVKELIENSLDAGATRIRLEVTDGGAKSVSVTDNGHGIPADEIALAFERFATSKIDETSDLSGIATLGFRGEALPSIGSVARVEAVSRVDGSDSGARIVIDNGQVSPGNPRPVRPGRGSRSRGCLRTCPPAESSWDRLEGNSRASGNSSARTRLSIRRWPSPSQRMAAPAFRLPAPAT